MKRIALIGLGVLMSCLMITNGWAQDMSSGDFDKLKKLEGEWRGTKPDGSKVTTTYKIMSGGSAVIETMIPEGEPSMVSVYHMDGDKLMMTHYCSAGNQPRMVAPETDNGTVDFNFMDATNLKEKSEGHMVGLQFVFEDNAHFKQVWSWSEAGKETPSTFEYKRAK